MRTFFSCGEFEAKTTCNRKKVTHLTDSFFSVAYLVRVDVDETLVGVRSGLDDHVRELILVEKSDDILGHFEMTVGAAVERHHSA